MTNKVSQDFFIENYDKFVWWKIETPWCNYLIKNPSRPSVPKNKDICSIFGYELMIFRKENDFRFQDIYYNDSFNMTPDCDMICLYSEELKSVLPEFINHPLQIIKFLNRHAN